MAGDGSLSSTLKRAMPSEMQIRIGLLSSNSEENPATVYVWRNGIGMSLGRRKYNTLSAAE